MRGTTQVHNRHRSVTKKKQNATASWPFSVGHSVCRLGFAKGRLLGALAVLVIQASGPTAHGNALDSAAFVPSKPPGVQLEGLRADPNLAVTELGWMERQRAKVGLAVPLWERGAWRMTLPGFIEIHNRDSNAPFPHQFWRARVAVALGQARSVRLGTQRAHLFWDVALAHESDHETANLVFAERSQRASQTGFEAVNDYRTSLYENLVSLAAGLVLPWGPTTVLVEGAFEGHFLSCTDAASVGVCDYTQVAGAQGVTGRLGVVITHREARRWWQRGYLALHADQSAGGRQVLREARAKLDAGLAWPTQRAGQWALAASLLSGNRIGQTRDTEAVTLGVYLRWVPALSSYIP